MWNTLKIVFSIIIIAVFSFRLWTFATSPGVATTETEPRSIFGDRLIAFSPGNPHQFTLKDRSASWEYWLFQIGEDAIALGKWMALQPDRAPRGDVQIMVHSELTDRYGNPSVAPTFAIRWSREDWSKVAWKTIQPDQIIALGDMKLAFPAVRPGVVAWCQRNAFRNWPDCASTPLAIP